MPVLLSRHDAQLAAAGCRALAFTLRTDAERQSNARIQEQTLNSATRLERLAQLFDDHAVATPNAVVRSGAIPAKAVGAGVLSAEQQLPGAE